MSHDIYIFLNASANLYFPFFATLSAIICMPEDIALAGARVCLVRALGGALVAGVPPEDSDWVWPTKTAVEEEA